MKVIKFTDEELEFLINHYELELFEAETYVEEIKGILKKLGSISEGVVEKPEKVAKKRGRPKLEKPALKAEPLPVLVEMKATKAGADTPNRAKPGRKPAEKGTVTKALKPAKQKAVKKPLSVEPKQKEEKVTQPVLAKEKATPKTKGTKKRVKTPAKKSATPEKKAATPAKKPATPAKKAATPTKKAAAPVVEPVATPAATPTT